MDELPLAAVLGEIARARAARPDLDWAAFDRCAPVGAAHGRRSTFPWHLTASVFVVDAAAGRVLLVEHPTLGRLLQPGGHVERGETLREAAGRELREECGAAVAAAAALDGLASDVDLHAIPANPRKGEPAHAHLDSASSRASPARSRPAASWRRAGWRSTTPRCGTSRGSPGWPRAGLGIQDRDTGRGRVVGLPSSRRRR